MREIEWRPVPDWPGYQVSEGKVRSINRVLPNGQFCAGKTLAQHRDRKGYWAVTLRDGSRKATIRVHVLVAAAFHGERPAGSHVLHKGDDKNRNTKRSLRYGTPLENEREKREKNRKKTEEKKKKKEKGIGEQAARARAAGSLTMTPVSRRVRA